MQGCYTATQLTKVTEVRVLIQHANMNVSIIEITDLAIKFFW